MTFCPIKSEVFSFPLNMAESRAYWRLPLKAKEANDNWPSTKAMIAAPYNTQISRNYLRQWMYPECWGHLRPSFSFLSTSRTGRLVKYQKGLSHLYFPPESCPHPTSTLLWTRNSQVLSSFLVARGGFFFVRWIRKPNQPSSRPEPWSAEQNAFHTRWVTTGMGGKEGLKLWVGLRCGFRRGGGGGWVFWDWFGWLIGLWTFNRCIT